MDVYSYTIYINTLYYTGMWAVYKIDNTVVSKSNDNKTIFLYIVNVLCYNGFTANTRSVKYIHIHDSRSRQNSVVKV